MLHLRVRVFHILGRIRSLSVPGPFLHQFRLQVTLEHLCDILAEHGEELVAVERSASCEVESLGGGVRGNDKVGGSGESVPFEC